MKVQLSILTLFCRQSTETIDLSAQISFFHGRIGSGKSSIARLIDYCLGGSLEETPALKSELVGVKLNLTIGDNEVVLEREGTRGSNVRVTWQSAGNQPNSVLAPLHADRQAKPLIPGEVYNLSDLLLHLLGRSRIMVRRSKTDEDTPLIRLSFRDFMWYCYLEQSEIDSSFFNLDDQAKRAKSRDVMRYVIGYYTERLLGLERELDTVTQKRRTAEEAASNLHTILEEFGLGSLDSIDREIEKLTKDLERVKKEIDAAREETAKGAHPVDALRAQLRSSDQDVARFEEALSDLTSKIDEEEALRAEMLAAKFKAARVDSAARVLGGVEFTLCPACGNDLHARAPTNNGSCHLCGMEKGNFQSNAVKTDPEVVRRDIEQRITELEESIARRKAAYAEMERQTASRKLAKEELDGRLTQERREYDSAYLARARRSLESAASTEQRIANLRHLRQLPSRLEQLKTEGAKLAGLESRLKKDHDQEKLKVKDTEKIVEELEREFLAALKRIGLPGISDSDRVRIDRISWIPWVYPRGEEASGWTFATAGSGGKKTLFNACFALALHLVATRRDLPLPTVLIIDTPMKNIGEGVNHEIFEAFYAYLYELANDELEGGQFILIDKDFVKPKSSRLHVKERYMTPDELDHPPLISYYRGP